MNPIQRQAWRAGIALVLIGSVLAGTGVAGPAGAGGFVTRGEGRMTIEELRVLYLIDEQQQRTTVTFEYAYSGGADFALVLPVPAMPEAVTVGDSPAY
ncbi:MAG: DUF2330 domain-containing protein, partial [Chloroflexi bacterium]|nr:DUF2330 domain-containing protein [Chloroflexota bacterium]